MSFEVTILGSSGGPIDGRNCSLLIKPINISYRQIIEQQLPNELVCVDAGSGSSSLSEIIFSEQSAFKQSQYSRISSEKSSKSRKIINLFRKYRKEISNYTDTLEKDFNSVTCSSLSSISTPSTVSSTSSTSISHPTSHHFSNPLLNLYHDSLSLNSYISAKTTYPFNELIHMSPFTYALKTLELISCYCITHPHLDHISSLVINSAGFNDHNPRIVYGLPSTIKALNDHIFNDIIWPNLTESFVVLKSLPPTKTKLLNENYKITSFEISHGETSGHCLYKSTAFLLNYTPTNSYILIFGDCESDSISGLSKNALVWNYIAPLILSKQLKSIVLECSNSNLVDSEPLYGHLTPAHLIEELLTLIKIMRDTFKCQDDNPLEGLDVLVTHIKESKNDSDPRKKILFQLNELNDKYDLRINFSVAFPGVSYVL